jgi:hypothetical protein
MSLAGLDRLLAVCLGCTLLGWSLLNLIAFWRTGDSERMASEIIGGRSFQTELVSARLAEAEAPDALGLCRASARRAAAILRLYLYEDAFAAGRTDLVDGRLTDLDRDLRGALHCIPSDSYLWLLLFSTENAANGFRPEYLGYLRMSYELGPHEGWISLKRNPVAIAMLTALDAKLSRAVFDEFASMVANGLYEETAAIFTNANPTIRSQLLNSLVEVPLVNRERFSRVLDKDLPFVPVPGVARESDRPWRQ